MNTETLHNAISLLPEDLLTPVDRLRQKKRIPWKSIAAAAACLCLATGLWLIRPGNVVSQDSVNDEVFYGNGAPAIKGDLMEESNLSGTSAGYVMEVLRVDADGAVVSDRTEGAATQDASLAAGPWTLTYENLEEAPQLQPGQRIRIYCKPEALDKNTLTIRPYKIEIIEEETQ